jgi:hypothetical protein
MSEVASTTEKAKKINWDDPATSPNDSFIPVDGQSSRYNQKAMVPGNALQCPGSNDNLVPVPIFSEYYTLAALL